LQGSFEFLQRRNEALVDFDDGSNMHGSGETRL
jgi:hypothetical protein